MVDFRQIVAWVGLRISVDGIVIEKHNILAVSRLPYLRTKEKACDHCEASWLSGMADGPKVGRHRRQVPWRKGRPAQGRHDALILFGLHTPFSIVAVSPARLPSLQSQWPELSAGPTVLPPASDP
jgi:hypothetical protein